MRFVSTSFYIPPESISRGIIRFLPDESNHICKVMRAKPGDEVRAVDGEGHVYRVKITRADPSRAQGEIIEAENSRVEPHTIITLGIGTILPKRLEIAWDSCVQLGVSGLVPVRTEYSLGRLREDGRFVERLEAVSKRAMLQCGRALLPRVEPPCELRELVLRDYDLILWGDEEGLPSPPAERPKLGERILLLVGPEGGFSSEERRIIADAGGIGLSLGPRRLRAENAAVVLSVIALRWSGDI